MEVRLKMDGALSQAEINALLSGVDGGNMKRSVVVTAYGHGKVIDRIAVSTFENSSANSYRDDQNENAKTYCGMINALEFSGDKWVIARLIPENSPVYLSDLLHSESFLDLILILDNRSLQKVFREVDNQELAKALKKCTEAVMEKCFKNMSSRASKMLKEDMEYMGPVRQKDVEEAHKRILSIIRHLEDTGEIVIRSEKEEAV